MEVDMGGSNYCKINCGKNLIMETAVQHYNFLPILNAAENMTKNTVRKCKPFFV